MMRGSPSAELLGSLLQWMRWVKTGGSTRALSAKIGAPPATVSQVENGQRALKEPKLAAWASALDVEEHDLHELWWLCQGLIRTASGRRIFYGDRPDLLPPAQGDPSNCVPECLEHFPELDSIYRLAQAICSVMRNLLPGESFLLRTWSMPFDQPTHHELARLAEGPLPVIWVLWQDPAVQDGPTDQRIPRIEKRGPVTRRRASTVATEDLGTLIKSLSGLERERVRGYIEAIIEDREQPDHDQKDDG